MFLHGANVGLGASFPMSAGNAGTKTAPQYAFDANTGIFSDADKWTVGVGYPGFANGAIDEIWKGWLIPKMFADAASGRLTPEAALDLYAGQVNDTFGKWRALKKV
jgi:hypothetical protein